MPERGEVAIVGSGLAGSEAAWQLAQLGRRVDLYEMRPQRPTPAHKTSDCAELVCSNSFKSRSLENAHGLLKAELNQFGSLILQTAERFGWLVGPSIWWKLIRYPDKSRWIRVSRCALKSRAVSVDTCTFLHQIGRLK